MDVRTSKGIKSALFARPRAYKKSRTFCTSQHLKNQVLPTEWRSKFDKGNTNNGFC